MGIRIYVEGDDQLMMGFHRLLRVDQARGRVRVRIVMAGGDPIGDYQSALRTHPDSVNLLLLDSEQQLDGTGVPQQKAAGFPADRVFWMVELMESWFLADREALRRYYGQGFQESALPARTEVEKISKKDVLDGLKDATGNTKKKEYHKTKHAPGILQTIDPDKVTACAAQYRRLLDVLNHLLAA